MRIQLSDREASILLGATLMHWGVPFRSVSKRQMTDHQQAIVDQASDKLIALREAHQRSEPREGLEVHLSDQEIALLVGVVDDCLGECGNDPTELSLELKTRDRQEVETLLGRLRLHADVTRKGGPAMSTVQRRPGVRTRRWTKEEYYRLGELGFFQGQRVELIEGRLMVHSPQKSLHAEVVDAVDDVFRRLFGPGYLVRCQLPLDLGQNLEPEPDVAVVVGGRGQYRNAHPTSAVLIVEVSDTTLSYDRQRKGGLYARSGVADYWIVNLVDQQVEVYQNPQPNAAAPHGFHYASRTDLRPPATVIPLALPQAVVAVADLL